MWRSRFPLCILNNNSLSIKPGPASQVSGLHEFHGKAQIFPVAYSPCTEIVGIAVLRRQELGELNLHP